MGFYDYEIPTKLYCFQYFIDGLEKFLKGSVILNQIQRQRKKIK